MARKSKAIPDRDPCPHCACTYTAVRSFQHYGQRYYVICRGPECYARGPLRYSAAEAVEAWNTRIPRPLVRRQDGNVVVLEFPPPAR